MLINPEKYKILLVDDEPDILEFLSYNLKKEGFIIYTAETGKRAIEIAQKHIPHLILLDVMIPEISGIEVCEKLRNIPYLESTIIAFLTARDEDYSQISGFEAGGDDYISKPIKPKVLISRIKALLKRSIFVDINENVGKIIIDKEKFLIYKEGKEIFLPKKEFELLELLYSKPNKVFLREEIFRLVWGTDVVVGDRTIDVHIRKLREKLGSDYISTVKGVGYKYVQQKV